MEKGHTQMECDSMHSNIEKQLKKVVLTSHCPVLISSPVKKLEFNSHITLEYSYFQNYKDTITHFISIRPGTKIGDPQVTDLRVFCRNAEVLNQLK